MRSRIYQGRVRHRRFQPREHSFQYRLFLMYLDLSELPELLDRHWLWSARRPNLAWFRRGDYLGDPARSLDREVRGLVKERTGLEPSGPICMLTHLRYFGYCRNPVSFYYCWDRRGKKVEAVVAEIHNTPWGERFSYVLRFPSSEDRNHPVCHEFDKAFHVSPFMPMELRYRWKLTEPGERLTVHMENLKDQEKIFDATMILQRRELCQKNLNRALVRFPLVTTKVIGAIYWQALRLWLKRTPFFPHPKHQQKAAWHVD